MSPSLASHSLDLVLYFRPSYNYSISKQLPFPVFLISWKSIKIQTQLHFRGSHFSYFSVQMEDVGFWGKCRSDLGVGAERLRL